MAAGLGGVAPAVLRDLGSVSRGAALAGAEATAMIEPGGAVTFRFAIQAAGDYTLRVRHDGDGLSLVALTPAGVATIDPGPAGPFRGVPLRLAAATYEVTASATGGRPVFVDWELLLNSGVGQAASTTPGALLALPPTPSGAAPPGAPAPDPAGTSAAWGEAASVAAPPAQSLTYPVAGPMMGRPGLDPAATPQVPPPLDATVASVEAMLTNVVQILAPGARPTYPESAEAPEAGHAAGPSAEAGPEVARFAAAGLGPAPLDPPAADDPADDPWCRPGLIGPGLCVGGVAVAAGVRHGARHPAPAPPHEVIRQLLGRAGGLDPRRPSARRPITPPPRGGAG